MSVNIVTYERPVENVLGRLQGVRQTGEGRWVALCPAHQDKNPSLSLREAPDGTVLVRCHAGCPTAAVLAALDLTWGDLFPAGSRRPQTPRERKAVREEAAVRSLATQFDQACEEAHDRLAVLFRTVGRMFAVYGLHVAAEEAAWVRELPHLEYVLDLLMARDPEERLAGLEEARRWLI